MIYPNTKTGTILQGKVNKWFNGTYAEIKSITPFNNILTGEKYEVSLSLDNDMLVSYGLDYVNSYFDLV